MNIQYQVTYYPYTLESFNSTKFSCPNFHSDLEASALQFSQFRPLAIKNERQFPFPGGRESLFQLEKPESFLSHVQGRSSAFLSYAKVKWSASCRKESSHLKAFS